MSDSEDLKTKFSEIFDVNGFKGRLSRSGEGSDLEQTKIIRKELPQVIQSLDIQVLMDAPCGDWYWMRHSQLSLKQYIGIDIVPPLIEENQRMFGDASHSFRCMDLTRDPLPQVDLILCRDCLVHLSYQHCQAVLQNFKRSRSTYLLTTTFPSRTGNSDLVTPDDFWRPLNLERPPFSLPEPILVINEGCTEEGGAFDDKSLALWRLDQIPN